jgi:hypothetical protein
VAILAASTLSASFRIVVLRSILMLDLRKSQLLACAGAILIAHGSDKEIWDFTMTLITNVYGQKGR